jgi:hypothetical protein
VEVNFGTTPREANATVRAATTANITIATALNDGDTLDGVTLAAGERVLVKDQSAAEENGVYVVGATPARDADFDAYDEHPGILIAVQEGTANEDTLWLCTSDAGGTLDTTAIAFAEFTGSGGGAGRDLLTANRTYYVRADGDDGNTGLVDSAGGAFLTIQKAIDVAATLDLGGFVVTIDVGNGTYTDPVTLKSLVGGDAIIIGDETTPSNVLIDITGSSCFSADGVMSPWDLRGMKLQSTVSQSAGINALSGSVVRFQNIDFGAQGSYDILIIGVAVVRATGNYTISAGKSYHCAIFQNGVFRAQFNTVTLSGTPAWGNSFLLVDSSSVAVVNGVTYSGAATGKRYDITLNGVIQTGGGGASYLPGDVAGTEATGGQYA